MSHESRLRLFAKKIPFLYWLAGAMRYAAFRRRLRRAEKGFQQEDDPRLPPPKLRHRVHGALDRYSYESNGMYLASLLAKHIRQWLPSIDRPRILDFASGPGRVTGRLKEALPRARLVGSDIDGEAIEWASRQLGDLATFVQNDIAPPTAFADDSFDAIYSISLFTHLDEPMQMQWLRELVRILRPGGVLIATTHGAACLPACTSSDLVALRERGFAFRAERRGKFKLDGLPDFYQTTFHTKEYVLREWSKFALVECFEEGGVNGHQDLVVLRKRPVSSHQE